MSPYGAKCYPQFCQQFEETMYNFFQGSKSSDNLYVIVNPISASFIVNDASMTI